MFIEDQKVQVLLPVAKTVSAMIAAHRFHRRVLQGNSLQELMFLQKEETMLKVSLWPQQ